MNLQELRKAGRGGEPRPWTVVGWLVAELLLDCGDIDLDQLGQPGPVLRVGLVEVADHGLADLLAHRRLAEVGGQVLDQVVLFDRIQGAVELTGLAEVVRLSTGLCWVTPETGYSLYLYSGCSTGSDGSLVGS